MQVRTTAPSDPDDRRPATAHRTAGLGLRTARALAPALQRTCTVLAAVFVAWAHVVWSTGGGALDLGPLVISSRNPLNPILLAVLFAAAAVALSHAGAGGRTDRRALDPRTPRHRAAETSRLREERDPGTPAPVAPGPEAAGHTVPDPAVAGRTAPSPAVAIPAASGFAAPGPAALAAAAVAAAVVWAGLSAGALVVGGSDSYGYVSQARMWAQADLRVEAPLVNELTGVIPAPALIPLGHGLAADGRTLAPVYAPGLPMTMGLAERLFGPRAVFTVMPLLAGLAVWLTYLLGRQLAGPASGLVAAIFLACSPAFLHQLLWAPMSDIPATAWWTASLVLLFPERRGAALASGLAAGAAILTRPNLVLLGIVPGLVLLTQAVRRRTVARARLALFCAGSLVGCLALGALNTYWYGSPLTSGYGRLDGLFNLGYLPENLANYPRWILETQTPIVLIAAAAPIVLWRRSRPVWLVNALAGLTAIVFASYMFYHPFDGWWSLRFLLPAYPALLALSAATLLTLARRLPATARLMTVVAITAMVANHGLLSAHERGSLNPAGEWRYAVVGAYVAGELPGEAILFSMQHSGSLRYYSGRMTVRYDLLPPDRLDSVVEALHGRGYRTYFLLDPWEEDEVRAQHAGTQTVRVLDGAPLAVLEPGAVRLYEIPQGREATAPDQTSSSWMDHQ